MVEQHELFQDANGQLYIVKRERGNDGYSLHKVTAEKMGTFHRKHQAVTAIDTVPRQP